VTTERYIFAASSILPPWWGLMFAKPHGASQVRFKILRAPQANPMLDATAVAALLWKSEALEVLQEGEQARKARNKTRREIYKLLAEQYPLNDLLDRVAQRIKLRGDWRSDALRMSSGD